MATNKNVLFSRTSNNEDSDDVWDDSALIRAYDKAVNKIKNDLTKSSDKKEKKKKAGSGDKESKTAVEQHQTSAEWKLGDRCVAVFADDGLAYPGVIIEINGNNCRVRYDYYENEEDKLLEELYPANNDEEPKAETKAATIKPKQSSAKHQQKVHQPQQELPSELNFPIPPPPPPLPASLISHFQNLNLNEDTDASLDNKEAFYSMLMSWYMSGYHTGYYFGLTQRQKE